MNNPSPAQRRAMELKHPSSDLPIRELTQSEKDFAWRMTSLIRQLETDFVNISSECVEELATRHKLLPSLVIQVARNLGIQPGPKHRRGGL